MADGTIRFYSGLMDLMTDDELRYVVGHEIGHVKAGHTRKRMQAALAASAAQKGVAASGTRAGALADSQLGDLIVQVVRAQHSQGNERGADDYAMGFMSRRKYDRKACVTALEESKASGTGLTFHVKGTTLGGAVTGVGSSCVTVRNHAGIAVVRIDSIDAVAGAITLK